MFIDRILYPVTTLGPGKRLVLWTAGCSRRCAGCANPELWEQRPYQEVTPEQISHCINQVCDETLDGITITGGEPFEQADDLVKMLEKLTVRREILIYTGFKFEEVKEKYSNLVQYADVIIDGAYKKELNDGTAALRGSTNQKIYYLNLQVKDKYVEYLTKGRSIENFVYDYNILSVGIHNL